MVDLRKETFFGKLLVKIKNLGERMVDGDQMTVVKIGFRDSITIKPEEEKPLWDYVSTAEWLLAFDHKADWTTSNAPEDWCVLKFNPEKRELEVERVKSDQDVIYLETTSGKRKEFWCEYYVCGENVDDLHLRRSGEGNWEKLPAEVAGIVHGFTESPEMKAAVMACIKAAFKLGARSNAAKDLYGGYRRADN